MSLWDVGLKVKSQRQDDDLKAADHSILHQPVVQKSRLVHVSGVAVDALNRLDDRGSRQVVAGRGSYRASLRERRGPEAVG